MRDKQEYYTEELEKLPKVKMEPLKYYKYYIVIIFSLNYFF